MPTYPKDYSGQRFGRRVIIKEMPRQKTSRSVRRVWLCRCDCGTEQVKDIGQLKAYPSCGCLQKEIVKGIVSKIKPGDKFGHLTAIRFIPKLSEKDTSQWECFCSCGKTVNVRSYSLLHGRTQSCGCKSNEIRHASFLEKGIILDHIVAKINRWFHYYTKSAKERGLDFTIDLDFFRNTVTKDCWYCGAPAELQKRKFNGLDRMQNDLGYTPENCLPCCWICNKRKSASNYDEFRDWVTTVANNLKKKTP